MYTITTIVLLVVIYCVNGNRIDQPNPLYKWSNSSGGSYLNRPPPTTSTNAEYNGINSCGGGGDSNMSWSCPHLMLLSPDMINAAKKDGNEWALYGVAGIGQTADCGKCFQLEITGDNRPSGTTKFIVQAVNTGSDVGSGQFDILMGGGGLGLYDGCSSDCKTGRVCSGGHCNGPMYSGDFTAWTPDGNCYGGGIRDADGCDRLVTTPVANQNYAEKTLVYGCKVAIQQNYHSNFPVNFKSVKCPRSLYQLTGILSKNENVLSVPRKDMKLSGQGRTTTTMDCCKPTCAWRQNTGIYTDSNWPQVFVCDQQGYPRIN